MPRTGRGELYEMSEREGLSIGRVPAQISRGPDESGRKSAGLYRVFDFVARRAGRKFRGWENPTRFARMT